MARGRSGGAAPTEQYQAVGQQTTSEKTGKFVNDPVGGAPPSEAIPGTSKAFMRWWIRRTESDLTIGAELDNAALIYYRVLWFREASGNAMPPAVQRLNDADLDRFRTLWAEHTGAAS